jgi:hypothetical protein
MAFPKQFSNRPSVRAARDAAAHDAKVHAIQLRLWALQQDEENAVRKANAAADRAAKTGRRIGLR